MTHGHGGAVRGGSASRSSCASYSDRGSHFWLTPKVGGKVDAHADAVGASAARAGGANTRPAYSPQARGAANATLGPAGRLPQQLRLRGIQTVEQRIDLREHYIAEFNGRFRWRRPSATPLWLVGARIWTWCSRCSTSAPWNRGNTRFQNLTLQIERVSWR